MSRRVLQKSFVVGDMVCFVETRYRKDEHIRAYVKNAGPGPFRVVRVTPPKCVCDSPTEEDLKEWEVKDSLLEGEHQRWCSFRFKPVMVTIQLTQRESTVDSIYLKMFRKKVRS